VIVRTVPNIDGCSRNIAVGNLSRQNLSFALRATIYSAVEELIQPPSGEDFSHFLLCTARDDKPRTSRCHFSQSMQIRLILSGQQPLPNVNRVTRQQLGNSWPLLRRHNIAQQVFKFSQTRNAAVQNMVRNKFCYRTFPIWHCYRMESLRFYSIGVEYDPIAIKNQRSIISYLHYQSPCSFFRAASTPATSLSTSTAKLPGIVSTILIFLFSSKKRSISMSSHFSK